MSGPFLLESVRMAGVLADGGADVDGGTMGGGAVIVRGRENVP
jgi:hypothetical protein